MNNCLSISSEILEKLNADAISKDELAEVVNSCCNSKELVSIKSKGEIICHAQISNIVLWVRYKANENCIDVLDYYYNRTLPVSTSKATETELEKKNKILENFEEGELICLKCNKALELRKIIFKYMKHEFQSVGFACPVCGIVFEPPEMLELQREKIEKVLEGK